MENYLLLEHSRLLQLRKIIKRITMRKPTSSHKVPKTIDVKYQIVVDDALALDCWGRKCLLHGECDVLIPSSLWGNRLTFI